MRIHTDTIGSADIYNATDTATREGGAPNGRTVRPSRFDLHKSLTRRHAYEILLTGNNPRRQMGNRDNFAATYDEWGWFLSHLFTVDPDAVAGPYNGADDFHEQTHGAYRLPVNA